MIKLSGRVGPAKKSEAYEIACRLLTDRDAVSEHDLEALLLYFAPKPRKKPKSAYEWVSLAASKDDARQFLCAVHCDGEWMVATDGHRLHLAPADGLPEGIYQPGVEPMQLERDLQTPPWRDLGFPAHADEFEPFDEVSELPKRLLEQAKWLGGDVWLVQLPNNRLVRLDYWQQAIACSVDGIVYREQFVVLRTPHGQAALAYYNVPEGWEDE